MQHDWWQLRSTSTGKDGSDEELYMSDHLVIWSKGSLDGAGQVIKTFSMDSSVQQVKKRLDLYSKYILPAT